MQRKLAHHQHASTHFPYGKIHLSVRVGKNAHGRRLVGEPAHIFFRIRLFNARQNQQTGPHGPRTNTADMNGGLTDTLNNQPHGSSPFPLRIVTFVPGLVSMASSLQSCRLR